MTALREGTGAAALRRLAASAGFRAQRDDLLASLDGFVRDTLACAAIPAPTFQEHDRAAWVAERLRRAGLADVAMDDEANVVGTILGEEPGIVISAHTDTVFSHDEHRPPSRVDGRLVGPGVGDNSVGVVGMIEVGRRLLSLRPRRSVWLAATTGEEGLGNLKGVRRVVDSFSGRAEAFVAIEGHFLGRVVTGAVGSRRWRFRFVGEGGHSWHDHGRPSAVLAAADFVHRAGRLRLPRRPRTTFNAGRIGGGEGVNVIAREAWVEVDLRSEAPAAMEKAAAAIEALARDAASREGVEVESAIIGDRPAGSIARLHPLVASAVAALRLVGETTELQAASTDANYPLSRRIPSVCLGITRGGGMHTPAEWIETEPLGRGLVQVLALAATLSAAQA